MATESEVQEALFDVLEEYVGDDSATEIAKAQVERLREAIDFDPEESSDEDDDENEKL